MLLSHWKIGKKYADGKRRYVLVRFGNVSQPLINEIQDKNANLFLCQKIHKKASTNFLKDLKFISEFKSHETHK